jgi:Ser/Thr protein kinase RdoA (MazF antagonist)
MATVEEAERLEPQARQALAQYGLPAPSQLELLTFSENAVFRAFFDSAESVIVRLHSIGYHTKAAVESELLWVEAIRRDTDVAVPPVIRTPAGDGVVVATDPIFPARLAAVFGDLAGAAPSMDDMIADYRILGRTTAKLHRHACDWTPPAAFERISWDLAGTFGEKPTWGRWQDGPSLAAADISVLAAAEDLIRNRLTEYGRGPNRYGLIHSDLRLANILMRDGVAQVIDFDDCGFGWYLYDLASALTFIEDDPQVPELVASWLAGYTEVRPLDDADFAITPSLIMLRRMVILAWLGSRPGTPVFIAEAPNYARVTGEMARTYLASSGTDVCPGTATA